MCANAIRRGELIHREGAKDKEFHFQNWFERRLREHTHDFEAGGRNSYPDSRLSYAPVGFELKGLAYPGRDASYDCNSQPPCGHYRGRDGRRTPRAVYAVFGRYPAQPDGASDPVIDFVICHGSFLDAAGDYVHKNKPFRGFGSYGDILVRDRKMYVAPTPFAPTDGVAHQRTLILPADEPATSGLVKVGELVRREVAEVVVAYAFDLEANELTTRKPPNPDAGREHRFPAYRAKGDPTSPTVTLRGRGQIMAELEAVAPEDDGSRNATSCPASAANEDRPAMTHNPFHPWMQPVYHAWHTSAKPA